MLVPVAADGTTVIPRALATISTVCTVLVIASFALFAHDQVAGASQHQQTAELPNAAALASTKPVASHKPHAQPRRFIDGAASTLTSPFHSVVASQNPWVDHGIPAVLALAVYGLGLGYLARFSRGMA
jgi:hypothetical protein